MENEIKKEVGLLLKSGERDKAIQYLRETFAISLQDAHALIEALEREAAESGDKDGSIGVAAPPHP
jgi:hypothetical protein